MLHSQSKLNRFSGQGVSPYRWYSPRAGTKVGNKGYDCAVAAIEMVNLIREIEA